MMLNLSISKMKRLEYKVKPPFTGKGPKIVVFPEFSSGKNNYYYSVSGEVIVTKNASNSII
jgi:hypothetical protein